MYWGIMTIFMLMGDDKGQGVGGGRYNGNREIGSIESWRCWFGWILRVVRYFFRYGLSENKKLEAAVVFMDGDAIMWYQWENKRLPFRLWAT